ncbi:cell division protein ZapB [Brassicibacter mesophilus]|uniref:cell division protein ZapB n=1 Tax=Brassicibacter mesophilus TaxID=745119 RepID=UPI003D19A22C
MWQKLKGKKTNLFMVSILAITLFLTWSSTVSFGEPGNEDDPLVTFSYVEKRIEQVKFYIEEKIKELSDNNSLDKAELQRLSEENNKLKEQIKQLSNSTGSTGIGLEIVELKSGQRIICGAGTEIILRSGSAKAIDSDLGGLSDLTGAKDLQADESIALNHLILIPRNDGRGAYVDKNFAIFIVKGYYEIY